MAKLHKELARLYGVPNEGPRCPPLESLILTLLSQNTNDRNRDRAYQALRARFPTWEAVARARPGEIAAAIRPGGLANVKSSRILEILREIKARYGAYDLDFLRGLPAEEAAAVLQGFNGVGPKTVSCVLLFGCGHQVFPVDTHILRISKRLGFVGEKTSLERAHALLAEMVPADIRFPLHLNLIRFGREVCRAQRPRCEVCPFRRYCLYYASVQRAPARAASRSIAAPSRG